MMTTGRLGTLALVIFTALTVATSGCDQRSRRIERFENGLHLQPRMDVAHLFNFDSAGLRVEDRMRERVFEPLGRTSCAYEFPFSQETLARVAFPPTGKGSRT